MLRIVVPHSSHCAYFWVSFFTVILRARDVVVVIVVITVIVVEPKSTLLRHCALCDHTYAAGAWKLWPLVGVRPAAGCAEHGDSDHADATQ